jgi:gag-polyprotein putative aspartyl protease/Aspartyl protease
MPCRTFHRSTHAENDGITTTPRYQFAPRLAALLWLAVLPFSAIAQTPPESVATTPSPPPATPAAVVEEVLVSAPEPRYVAPTTRDHIGRIWAPVHINGKGPYRLVLDTGATRSAILQRVADEAQLPINAKPFRLRGVTGTRSVPAAHVKTLAFGDLVIENILLPIVPEAFGGADGVLGGEVLKDKRIAIEFRKDRISIARSHGKPASPAYSVVPFKYATNHGMRISVMVGPIRTVAVIDTGSQATVGNFALRQALARRRDPRDVFDTSLIGVTEDIQTATRVRVPSISAGKLRVHHAEILFSDLQIFDYWQLNQEPALLIGMDVLGVVDALVIDYRRKELHFRTGSTFEIESIGMGP